MMAIQGKVFSTLDLMDGYYQLSLAKESRQVTAFATSTGLYQYTVLPMGLSSAPALFNRMVAKKLKDINCHHDFDDVLVGSPDLPTHVKDSQELFDRARREDLKFKLGKCRFGRSEVKFLGDFISHEGIRADPEKTEQIRKFKIPLTKVATQRFIGIINYVSRFIPDYTALIAPWQEALTGLPAARSSLKITTKMRENFEALKTRLSQPPVLARPDWERAFHVKMDASDLAAGGYLFQLGDDGTERILAYGGRKFTPAERNYATREKELLAVLIALKQWRIYLLDGSTHVYTDHRTLETLLTQSTCSQHLARWLHYLAEFKLVFH